MTRFKQNLIAFNTVVIKETQRIIRSWMQALLPSAITTVLYFLIFGSLIGPRIGIMGGFPYIQYIAPGLIMMAIITNSYANTCTSLFFAKFQRSIEEMLVSPLPNSLLLLGYVTGGIIRGLIIGLIVGIITLFFTHLHLQHVMLLIIVVILSAMLFSLAGMVNGIIAKNFDDIAIIPTFVLTPLTYLGGVFYSVNMLPPFWQKVSLANPILYIINAFRYGFLNISDVNVYFALSMIVLCNIVLFGLCMYMLNKGVGIRT